MQQRVELVTAAPGAKQAMVRDTVMHLLGEFTTKELDAACPTVSREMTRYVLREMQAEGTVERVGERRGSKWRRIQ
jgi:DNA-binding HxlR family transcriptional regulator